MKAHFKNNSDIYKAMIIAISLLAFTLVIVWRISVVESAPDVITYHYYLEEVVCTCPEVYEKPCRGDVCLNCPQEFKKMTQTLKKRTKSEKEYVQYMIAKVATWYEKNQYVESPRLADRTTPLSSSIMPFTFDR